MEYLLGYILIGHPQQIVKALGTRFLCASQKKKFGLNCQTVCDAVQQARILDISIQYPGSTSDCLAFEGMSLVQQLEQGILDPRLCLYGNNVYVNTPQMATPYTAVSGDTKDAQDFII